MSSIQGLICIDLWDLPCGPQGDTDEKKKAYDQWIDQLVKKLSTFNFDSIIDAGYNKKINIADISVYNTLLAYNWSYTDDRILLELIKNSNTGCETNKKVSDNLYGKNTFALYSIDSFIKHANHMVPHIKDWLVVGSTWKICVHFRDLGLVNLSKIDGHNFYGTNWGFYYGAEKQRLTDDDFKNDEIISWTQVSDDMYKVNRQQETTV